MDHQLLTALMVFSFVSSITPGPNNLMLMSSGANFGFKQTVPHMLGVAIGFTLMVVLVGLGVMQMFERFPVSYQILKVFSIIYLCYLASKIAMSSAAVDNSSSNVKPFSFIQAALFQWVNPKAWTMAISAISIYAPSKSISAILLVAAIFGMVNLPCISTWVLFGQKAQSYLTNKRRLKTFNITMALLLILSLYPVLF